MYENAKSCVHLNGQLSDESQHQGWCPSGCRAESSTLHNYYESLIKGIQKCLPLGIIYTDDLVLMAEIDDLKKKLTIWGHYRGIRAPCQRQQNKTCMQQT